MIEQHQIHINPDRSMVAAVRYKQWEERVFPVYELKGALRTQARTLQNRDEFRPNLHRLRP